MSTLNSMNQKMVAGWMATAIARMRRAVLMGTFGLLLAAPLYAACDPEPRPGCQAVGSTQLQVQVNPTLPSKNRLKLQFKNAVVTDTAVAHTHFAWPRLSA